MRTGFLHATCWTALTLLLVGAPIALVHAAAAQETSSQRQQEAEAPALVRCDLGQNAALKYWQAFSQLPKWNERQEHVISNWSEAPQDGEAQAVADAAHTALIYLHRGASIEPVDWGLDYEDGPALLLPHLSKARELARLAGLRARLAFQRGDEQAAIKDLADAMVLGRHVGQDQIVISLLVEAAIQSAAIDPLAKKLPHMQPATLQLLAQRIDTLPTGGSLSEIISEERRYFLDWAIDKLKAEGEKGLARDIPDVIEPIRKAGGVESAIRQLEAYRSYYDQASKLATLPPEQFRQEIKKLAEQFEHSPIADVFLTSYERVYDVVAKSHTRLAMLRAAIDVLRGGRDALGRHEDTYGEGPFEYRELPDGFELRSDLTVDGQPVTLTVGKPAAN